MKLIACVAGVFLALLSPRLAEADVRRVLLLQSADRENLTLDSLTEHFRAVVEAGSADPVTFVQFVVNPSGFETSPDDATIRFLQSAFSDRARPDLVVAIGGPAAQFARNHRQSIFPELPLLLAGADQRFVRATPPGANEAVVASANDMAGVVDDIRQLFPDTTHVFMLVGSGEQARFWKREIQQDVKRYGDRIRFTWSDAMSYAQIIHEAGTLPPHSAILFITSNFDARGVVVNTSRLLTEVHAVANAPLFSTQEPHLGYGVVGGHMMPVEEVARTAAGVAIQLLNGASPDTINVPAQRVGQPKFDWRELRRWNVSANRLPLGSVILFREPGPWERYKWIIVAGLSALAAQTALIAALLLNRTRRRRAEQLLRESEGRFRVLADSAPVLIRIVGPDMDCTDVNRPWLSFTGRELERELGEGWIEGMHPDDRQQYRRACRDAFDSRKPFRSEYRLRRVDGEYRWVLDTSEPRFTADGSFAGYIASATDVTDLRTARAAISNLNKRLIGAHEEERTHLARELHDDVGQHLAFVAIELQQLSDPVPEWMPELKVRASRLQDSVSSLGSDIHQISHRLHSSKLEFLGLPAAAAAFCRETSAQRGVRVDFVHEHVPAHLSGEIAITLFRVLQEALSNALKHARATVLRVALRGGPETIVLDVVDDGCGFDVDAALKGHGLGLISMQERLRFVNGTMFIESKPGRGSTVRAIVPLPMTEADANTTESVPNRTAS
jgi:PAS domain S-box-containing protein